MGSSFKEDAGTPVFSVHSVQLDSATAHETLGTVNIGSQNGSICLLCHNAKTESDIQPQIRVALGDAPDGFPVPRRQPSNLCLPQLVTVSQQGSESSVGAIGRIGSSSPSQAVQQDHEGSDP